jgi:hypothetical protein
MHNLVRECAITFNDLVAARFDNYHLDFWSAFTVPAGKRTGYNNMIGNINELIQGHKYNANPALCTIPSVTLNLPLPFFYTRDSGVALPTAALPYNDVRITFSFRNWNELLILDNTADGTSTCATAADVSVEPSLQCVQVWSTYAIVSSDERKRMACAPRDILIEQVQTAPIQTFTPATNSQPSYDIRFSHSIKALFFAVRNKSTHCEWSNYTTASPVPGADGTVDFYPACALDPVLNTSLIYENTARLSCMGSDYFSLVNPWYHAPVIPLETGYHMYSYSLDFFCLDPMGSTNYGKLTNVSIAPVASQAAIDAANGAGAQGSGCSTAQRFDFITTAVNYNIVRISGKHCAATNSELPIRMGITV